MKIGIITLSASYNCGSMLQSYALKKILEQYGETEIINFSSEASHRVYDIVPSTDEKRMEIEQYRRGLLEELIEEENAYLSFKKDFMGIQEKEIFSENLPKISNKYDVVVAGSDQIWNVKMGDFDKAFFCSWTDVKKIAYAASLGGHDIRESDDYKDIKEAILKFQDVSVREEFGRECLEDILGKNIIKVLDPTLIYEVNNWTDIIKEPIVNNRYIFYYSWAYRNEELKKIVEERSAEMGLPVYVIDAHKWRKKSYKDNGFVLCEKAGPLSFLNLMYYAEECYVESFHGMLFAYLFKKDFWLLDVYKDYSNIDSRLRELLELFDMKDRVLTKYNCNNIDLSKHIDYKYNEKLHQMISTSHNYIKEALSFL